MLGSTSGRWCNSIGRLTQQLWDKVAALGLLARATGLHVSRAEVSTDINVTVEDKTDYFTFLDHHGRLGHGVKRAFVAILQIFEAEA